MTTALLACGWPVQAALVLSWLTVALVVWAVRRRRPREEVTLTCSDPSFDGTYTRKR